MNAALKTMQTQRKTRVNYAQRNGNEWRIIHSLARGAWLALGLTFVLRLFTRG